MKLKKGIFLHIPSNTIFELQGNDYITQLEAGPDSGFELFAITNDLLGLTYSEIKKDKTIFLYLGKLE